MKYPVLPERKNPELPQLASDMKAARRVEGEIARPYLLSETTTSVLIAQVQWAEAIDTF